MTHAPALVEALARHLCVADGKSPDAMVPYEEGGGVCMRRYQPEDGPKFWPEMPLWRWRYAGLATTALDIVVPMIRGEALEKAAAVAEDYNRLRNQQAAVDIAAAIRALKEAR